MEQYNNRSSIRGISHHSCKPKVHYHVHNRPPLVPFLIHDFNLHPHILLFGIYFHIIKEQSHTTPKEAQGERMYSSYSMTSALDEGEWSASSPGRALPPRKGHPVRTGQEAGWAPEPVWTQRLEEKSPASTGDRTSIARSSSPILILCVHLY
jgi:hypothetical protein